MNKNSGQNLVEFAILLSIVVVGSIAAYSMLGPSINNLLASSNTKFSGYHPFQYNAATTTSSDNTNSTPLGPSSPSDPSNPVDPSPIVSGDSTVISNVNGIDVYQNPDGSIAFEATNGQQVSIPQGIIDNMNTVIDSAGSSGTEKLVQMIAYMIEQHKDEYPGDVPVEISSGDSDRAYYLEGAPEGYPAQNVTGLAEINMMSVKVGNHVLIFENDQKNSTGDETLGKFDIEGYINNGTFNANIKSDDNPCMNGQSIAMNVDDSNGLELNGDMSGITATSGSTTQNYNINWNLNFSSDPEYNYQIGN